MLSERQQRSAIYAIFAGGDTKPDRHDPTHYAEPWRTILFRLTRLYDTFETGQTLDGSWRFDNHEAFIDCLKPAARLLRCQPDDVVRLLSEAGKERRPIQNMQQLSASLPSVTWLWQDWIPNGLLTLLGATPGTGKSWLALELSRMVIHGGAWPDGQPSPGGGHVVWVEAEAVAQITCDRCLSMGIDMTRFWPIVPPPGDIIDFSAAPSRDDLIELAQHVKPRLIVIDSLSGISSKGENNIEDIRRILAFLVGLAAEHDAGLVLIHHLKKVDRSQLSLPGLFLHDFRGSGHITAVARSIIGLSIQTPPGGAVRRTGPRLMEIVKATLVEEPAKLGMTIQSEGDAMRLLFGAAPTADDTTTGDECANWLMELLEANGPMKPREIIELAEAEGFERAMVYRARRKLAAMITNTLGHKNPKNEWKAADPDDIGSDDDDRQENDQ